MTPTKRAFKITGGLLIVFGIILGFLLSSVMVWGDLEGSLFTTGLRPDKSLSTLRCPIIITNSETGIIYATLNNPTQKTLERYLIANISEGYATLVREIRTNLPIPPEEKQKVEWKISPKDAAFEQRVILFRVFINPRYPYPSLGGDCGVVKLNIQGVTGNQLVGIAALLSFVSIGFGTGMVEYGIRPNKGRSRSALNSVYALVGIVIGSGILGYLGFWVPGLVLLAISAIMILVIVAKKLGGENS
jgi:hypothetical protein